MKVLVFLWPFFTLWPKVHNDENINSKLLFVALLDTLTDAKLTFPLNPLAYLIPCLMSTQQEEARKAKSVTSPWFWGLKIKTPSQHSQSSHLLLQPWYCNANTIALDRISEPTNCEMETRLTTSPISHVNATTVHGAQHNRIDTRH